MVASPAPQLGSSSRPHIHLADEVCPYCEQPIPNEKAEEVRARWEAKERELSDRLAEKFALEKAQMEASANAREDQARSDGAAALAKLTSEIAPKVAAAREEGKKAAEGMLQERLEEAERVKQEAATQVETLTAAQEAQIQQRVQEVREALQADKMDALDSQSAKHFEETQKLKRINDDMRRQLEKQTANELGEGAEIDLFETLKAEFKTDRIYRVKKGEPGADIVHEIIHNDKVCGKIVFDSKNRNAWRNDYVTKLRTDQLAEQAEHAILAAPKFPADQRQLCVQDGVIIANPARVLAVVQLLRSHIVEMHTMRLSNNERAQKTAALYEFIRSPRCQQLFQRIDSQAENLLKLQEQEKKALDTIWNRQGILCRSIQKTCGELTAEIDRIIGTGSDAG